MLEKFEINLMNMNVCYPSQIDCRGPGCSALDNTIHHASVVQKLDSAIHRINHYSNVFDFKIRVRTRKVTGPFE